MKQTPYPSITPKDLDRVTNPIERARMAADAANTCATYAGVFAAVRRGAVRELAASGQSYADIAEALDISKAMVQKILSR